MLISIGVLTLASLTPFNLPSNDAADTGDRVIVQAIVFVAGMALIGSLSFYRSRHMMKLMRTSPWVRRHFHVNIRGFGGGRPALVLLENAAAPEAVFVVSALVWRVGELEEHDGKEILVAGNPSKVVVLRLPDSDSLFLARRPIIGWWRNRLRVAVMTKRSSLG